MGLIQVKESGKLGKLRVSVGVKASRTLDRLHGVPSGKNLTYWSAAVLAFLIAPIAALSLSAKPGTKVNLESTSPEVSNTESVDTSAAAAQDSLDASINSGAATNSNTSKVETTISGSVKVNGQEIEVPENGTVNETIVNEDGQTTHVNIRSSNSSSSGDDQNSKSSVKIKTKTTVRSSN